MIRTRSEPLPWGDKRKIVLKINLDLLTELEQLSDDYNVSVGALLREGAVRMIQHYACESVPPSALDMRAASGDMLHPPPDDLMSEDTQ